MNNDGKDFFAIGITPFSFLAKSPKMHSGMDGNGIFLDS